MTADVGPSPVAERLLHVAAALVTRAQQESAHDTDLTADAVRAIDELRTLVREQTSDTQPQLVRMDSLAGALIDDYTQRVAAAADHGGVVGVRTGIDHLDETINGLEPGKLYILAAMPGAGKTTLALQIAATVAQAGSPALYISLENDATDLARKTVCRFGEISYAQALKGKVPVAIWRAGVAELAKLKGNLYVSAPRAVMPNIAELVEQVMEQAGRAPALVVVDYLQAWVKRLVGPAAAEDGVREHLDQFTPAMRTLGERYGTAVMAISSQNRAGYNAGGMSALKESGNIEYDSDVVMTLQRKELPAGTPPGVTLPIELTVNKNRQGMCGRPIALTLRGDWCMIDEDDL